MPHALTVADVERIAALAQLDLTDEEITAKLPEHLRHLPTQVAA